MGQVARERWSFFVQYNTVLFCKQNEKRHWEYHVFLSNLWKSCRQHDISQHNFSPVTAVIVRFRLALQLHKLLRGVCVCMHVFANTMDIFYPFLHVLDSWHLSTLGNFTSKDVLCTPSNPNSFLFFHCLLSLLTKTQRGISSTTLLPGDGGLVFAPHM